MRDPERIDRIARKFVQVWKATPDQRMGQLLSNLRGRGPQDVFYFEDDELEAALDSYLSRINEYA